jgi:predicted dehydrogenase
MALRVGIVSTAHLHVWSYAGLLKAHPQAEIVGVWDDDSERGDAFGERIGVPVDRDLDALLDRCDAAVIMSENLRHREHIERAAKAGKAILCEKPLVVSEEDADGVRRVLDETGAPLMTAFPCRYSPAFARLRERVSLGDVGRIRALCTTNRGMCPGGWFVQPDLSGGGAMIDHVVHVADLLRVLLDEEPVRVFAATGSNMYDMPVDDTAMLTIEFGSGIFATLDSSWSRPKGYKTWGDVTMNVVGDDGVLELDMFGPAVDRFADTKPSHTVAPYGSSLDGGLVDDFVRCALEGTPMPITAHDGIQAARVAIAGYRSAEMGRAVEIAASR